jgi:hypothetical protein
MSTRTLVNKLRDCCLSLLNVSTNVWMSRILISRLIKILGAAQNAMDIGEDEVVSDTQEPDEPDDFAIASMLLAAIHDILNNLSRLATLIYKTAGHFDQKHKFADEMTGLISPGARTVLAEEAGKSDARSYIPTESTNSRPSPESPSFSSVRFYVSWKHIAIHHQPNRRQSYYRNTSLTKPPVTKDGFRVFLSSSIYSWTPGTLRPVSTLEEKQLRIYRTSSSVWCPDHQTYLTVPYDCTEINVRDKADVDPLDDWNRLKFGHESFNGRPLTVIGHLYPEEILAGTGPSSWIGELIPHVHQRHGEPAPLNTHGTSLLAGDLSILLGLAALSTTPDQTRNVIQTSFWPTKDTSGWVPHGTSTKHSKSDRDTDE